MLGANAEFSAHQMTGSRNAQQAHHVQQLMTLNDFHEQHDQTKVIQDNESNAIDARRTD